MQEVIDIILKKTMHNCHAKFLEEEKSIRLLIAIYIYTYVHVFALFSYFTQPEDPETEV